MHRDEQGWKKEYMERDALWIHDGNPKRPHALLTSGNHSNGFFNSELVMEDPRLLDEAAGDLLELLIKAGLSAFEVERVVGPAMGAITLAHDLARHISKHAVKRCLRAYIEKKEGCEEMEFKRTSIALGERVLLAEDVLTTGISISKAITAVERARGLPHPFVAVLVNRSGHQSLFGCRLVSLISHDMPLWPAQHCPLCKEGSEAIKPKQAENWARLNASY